MLVWREKLESCPVMSLQTGGQLAVATEPIIDPKDFSIVAFYCEGPLINFQPAILHVSDVREYGELGLIINGSDNIMPLDDMVRLQDIIDYHYELIGKKVVDTTKHKLGKVSDYVLETSSFQIMKLSVTRPLLQRLQQSELNIDRRQIRNVSDNEIVVAAPTAEDDALAIQRHQIQNPFRHRPAERPVEHTARTNNSKSYPTLL